VTLENVSLSFRLGDSWVSEAWAVLVDDAPVDLVNDGWLVRCQARRTSRLPVIQEWSTINDRILIGEASVQYGDTGAVAPTSTIQLRHSAEESELWDPFAASFDIEIQRGVGANIERHTVISGRITALQDITDT
jgi:hypothetical protein